MAFEVLAFATFMIVMMVCSCQVILFESTEDTSKFWFSVHVQYRHLHPIPIYYLTLICKCNILCYLCALHCQAQLVICAVGMVLNGFSLVAARRQAARPSVPSRTNVHYLVLQLTIADCLICFVTLPMETLWRATIAWHAGNIVCKEFNAEKMFSSLEQNI